MLYTFLKDYFTSSQNIISGILIKSNLIYVIKKIAYKIKKRYDKKFNKMHFFCLIGDYGANIQKAIRKEF